MIPGFLGQTFGFLALAFFEGVVPFADIRSYLLIGKRVIVGEISKTGPERARAGFVRHREIIYKPQIVNCYS